MRYRILGPVCLAAAERSMVLNATRERTVLAVLVLRANQVVTVENLIDALWEEDPPSTARAQIHNCVSRMRRLLLEAGAPDDALRTVPAGYQLRVGPDEADHLVFEARLQAARKAVAAGEPGRARVDYRAALALWRGPALADVSAQVARLGALRLEEERITAAEEAIDVELRVGGAREVLPELTDLVRRYPLRDRLLGLLMTALAQVGRTADALAAYREGRRRLAAELGIRPGPELQELHRRILAGAGAGPGPAPDVAKPDGTEPDAAKPEAAKPDAALPDAALPDQTQPHPAPPEPAPPDAAPLDAAPPPRCLPRPIGDFTGREELVAQLVPALESAHPALIAVDGMAGAGKTTLAVHAAARVAHRYPDGHLYLDLHGHSESAPVEPAAALAMLLDQLGVPTAKLPTGLAERAARWRTELAHRRALILLDNAADSRQVAPLLPGASSSAVVITSRRRLTGLPDARRISLDLLRPEDSVRLLARIAGHSAVAPHPQAAAEVARRCGYLPLALRIAGARLASRPSWTMQDLAERLRAAEPPLVELAVEGSSVATAFTLSYRQLPAPAQRVFRLVGQHPGADFDAFAAAALADVPAAVARDLLEELVDANLVEQPAVNRYRLHDLLREYALRLSDSAGPTDESSAALTRLGDYYRHSVVNASAFLLGTTLLRDVDWGAGSPYARTFPDQDTALQWLKLEWRGALAVAWRSVEQGRLRQACLLSLALWHSLFRHGYTEETIDLQLRILRSTPDLGDPLLVGLVHHYLAGSYCRRGDADEATAHLDHAAAAWAGLDYPEGECSVLRNHAQIALMAGRPRAAVEHASRAIERAERLATEDASAPSHWICGQAYFMLGDYGSAMWHQRRALAAHWRRGQAHGIALALAELGRLHSRLGHLTVAAALLTRAEAMKRAVGNAMGAAEALSECGLVHLRAGRVEQALACHRQALEAASAGGAPLVEALLHNNLAETMCATGDYPRALAHGRVALRLADAATFPHEHARAQAMIASALVDDPAAALVHWERAVVMYTEMGSPERHEVAEQIRKLRHQGS